MTLHRPAPDPSRPDSRSDVYDLLIVGGTAPGIVAAVRAAREGLKVALVAAGRHLGGSLPSLGAVETHYRGNRAPLLEEFVAAVKDHYRVRHGIDSPQYRACTGGKMIMFEPHVAESVLERWVAAEPGLTVWRGFVPERVERAGRALHAVTFRPVTMGSDLTLKAAAFIEAGYEGDLMARAGVAYRIGRESRAEYGEPSAGRVFTRWERGIFPRAAAEGRLNLVTTGANTTAPEPGSTGEGDDNVQSYSYRLCLTDDAANRDLPTAPPSGYDRARYAPLLLPPAEKQRLRLPFHHRFLIQSLEEMAEGDHLFHGHALPNRKRSWNATNYTGAGKAYAEADLAGRRAIEQRHREHALGLLWFLQHDPALPEDLQQRAREWGLARDEFAESGNFPPQLYVREARRLVGRAVFTEHDARLAPGAERAPLHEDAIGITEFSLDCLACTTESRPGTLCDGQMFQMEVSRPGQVSWGCLLPHEFDNLVVVTTGSATHVGWGAYRQTPTLMHLAESGAWAVVLAARRGCRPAEVPVGELQRVLVSRGVMITFFNDSDMADPGGWAPGLQLLGARGLLPSYDAEPGRVLTAAEANAWLERLQGEFPAAQDAIKAGRTRGEVARRLLGIGRSEGSTQ